MENQMSQHEPDDTPKSADAPTRKQGDYYYDDATGYEIYKPEDEDKAGDEEAGTKQLTTEDTKGHGEYLKTEISNTGFEI
jgi:hypothetical protein